MARYRKAGSSAMDQFRAERRKNMRADWRSIAATIAVAIGLAIWLVVGAGWQQTLAAFLLGCYVTLLFVVWLLGFDAHALTWRWGAAGEEWTAEVLDGLGAEWRVYHDVPDGKGNWDHIVVGPPCVFVVDSKNLRGPISIREDGGRAGRLRFGGPASRGSAVRLKEVIERKTGIAVWVQAVVSVWGELSEAIERDTVLYVPGPRVASALENYPRRLNDADRSRIVAAVESIAAKPGSADGEQGDKPRGMMS